MSAGCVWMGGWGRKWAKAGRELFGGCGVVVGGGGRVVLVVLVLCSIGAVRCCCCRFLALIQISLHPSRVRNPKGVHCTHAANC